MRCFTVKLLIAVAALSLAGCDAVKLREHNLQLENLLNAREDADTHVRNPAADTTSQSFLDQKHRLDQIKADLAALSYDAAADSAKVDDKATKIAYLFTAARAGSKAGPDLANVFAEKTKKGRESDRSHTGAEKRDAGTPEKSGVQEKLVDPFYYGIVVPAQELCASYKNDWEKPARDCAYIEVVGYFAAVDELVADGRELLARKGAVNHIDGSAPATSEASAVFNGLKRQFNNVRSGYENTRTRSGKANVDPTFDGFIDKQLLRTFCSARRLLIGFSLDIEPAAEMQRYLREEIGPELKNSSGNPDCSKAE